MAFKKRYLQKLSNILHDDAGAPTGGLHFYQTTDAVSVVRAANYFDAVGTTLYSGDVIFAECNGVLRHLRVANSPTKGDAHVTVTDLSSGGKVFIAGQATTVTASDTIVTGLGVLSAAGASFDDNPGDNPEFVSASIGDQAGAPAAGSLLLKTWQNTSGTDPTPVAATTFGKKINWWAFGLPA